MECINKVNENVEYKIRTFIKSQNVSRLTDIFTFKLNVYLTKIL